MLDPIFQPPAEAGLARFSRRFQHLEPVIGMNLFKGGSLAQFRRRLSQDSFISRTAVEPPSFDVDQRDHVGGVLGDDPEQLFLFL
jgi:hypothetical protein